jgi:hypothetical protein
MIDIRMIGGKARLGAVLISADSSYTLSARVEETADPSRPSATLRFAQGKKARLGSLPPSGQGGMTAHEE